MHVLEPGKFKVPVCLVPNQGILPGLLMATVWLCPAVADKVHKAKLSSVFSKLLTCTESGTMTVPLS